MGCYNNTGVGRRNYLAIYLPRIEFVSRYLNGMIHAKGRMLWLSLNLSKSVSPLVFYPLFLWFSPLDIYYVE
jgi:hypothetical protein